MVARALGGIVAALLLVGCGGPRTVEVSLDEGAARLANGETLRVDLGEANASIGDSWHLVTPPDPTVLSDGTPESDADCDQPGCGARLSWRFTARGAGTTTLEFRYCYRSRPPHCAPQSDRGPDRPVRLTVTVT
jgi:predicted secreted protein